MKYFVLISLRKFDSEPEEAVRADGVSEDVLKLLLETYSTPSFVIKICPSEQEPKVIKQTKEISPMKLKYIGYSSHDDESQYRCPVCNKFYGGWDFVNGTVKTNEDGVFTCECGMPLRRPE